MASKRMKRREEKRIKLQKKWPKREELRIALKDSNIGYEEKFEILAKLEKMPRDASHVRLSRRCELTGRSRGVLRRFKVSRLALRRLANSGEVPGVVKSSW